MIKPSVGRIVLFKSASGRSELPAIVSGVVSEHSVHLHVFQHDNHEPILVVPNVQLLQDDDKPTGGHWAEWMDYQKGQAAKTETLGDEIARRLKAIEDILPSLGGSGAAD